MTAASLSASQTRTDRRQWTANPSNTPPPPLSYLAASRRSHCNIIGVFGISCGEKTEITTTGYRVSRASGENKMENHPKIANTAVHNVVLTWIFTPIYIYIDQRTIGCTRHGLRLRTQTFWAEQKYCYSTRIIFSGWLAMVFCSPLRTSRHNQGKLSCTRASLGSG